MLQFLNPIWFFAAAAMLIPVLIHLWNIRPGKVLKVGSTSLITAASRRSSRSFNLLDILLLLLRCLLLLLLAILLTAPIWQKHVTLAKAKGWVLLPRENFSEGYQHYKTSIDSLTKQGYEFHYFNTDFPKVDLTKLLAETKDLKTIDSVSAQPSSYWDILKQLDNRTPSNLPVYLYTTNSANRFVGDKPQAALNLHWQTFTPADSVTTWVHNAWFNSNNTIRVVEGNSKPSGTTYNYTDIQADKGNSQFTVNVNNGRPEISLANSKAKPVSVDTATLSIAIYNDGKTADAGYLKAALDAVAQFTQRKITVKQYSSANAIPVGESWIFWLSEQPFAARLLQKHSKIFAYQTGKTQTVNTSISTTTDFALPNGSTQIPMFKLVAATRNSGEMMWHDGFGHPVLTVEKQDNAEVYHFYSRFNPTWNDMAWDSSFPKLMLQLIITPAKNTMSEYDRRTLSNEQIQPVKVSETHVVADKFTIQKELGKYFWLALIAIFMVERWLATRYKTVQSNG
ncbi:BatA domain-containing protein [Mucilaginibacter agri]|uniref:Aerotolerance regulator N-terminal domain-containing protein n=1 Tax=Mucilaginibacter agri TaxID=2695265 RepID=A0A966DWJ9_9SPHI|nr:BatA domain-containing protein [Mucilaginibacter agri]NCD71469.1 hypothetical protein [Mucilaginibacter agri]